MTHGWQEQALCAQVGSHLFFPEKGEGNKTKAAKRICAACPVMAECLDYAFTLGVSHGIWGGTSERDRNRMRKMKEAA